MQEILKRAAGIKLLIFDVDGVLTDGSLYLGNDGEEFKAFNSKDGLGMKMVQATGVAIGIITARNSQLVSRRMKSLGIEHIYQGKSNKLSAFEDLKDKIGLPNEQIAYVGDDVVDLPIMGQVGLAVGVSDGHKFVNRHAHWITTSSGGRGAAREVCELLMEAQGTLKSTLESYL
ncbi:MAG: 3-deoxy-manno-octulosonate-8-phosphatase KdsC [Gammaproteobacteria bacterium]|nr:3-deoxy-manno-octulosonate-8-phosphatase KdsC [Gammaproteobacteria bacterium]